jgi:YD repeat-containing protein
MKMPSAAQAQSRYGSRGRIAGSGSRSGSTTIRHDAQGRLTGTGAR